MLKSVHNMRLPHGDPDAVIKAGFDAHVVKPINAKDLVRMIAQLRSRALALSSWHRHSGRKLVLSGFPPARK